MSEDELNQVMGRLDSIERSLGEDRLGRIEQMLATFIDRETIKEWYSTDEFARLLGKAEFTVREWARLGRIKAEKRQSGRGAYAAWVVSHAELLRYRQHGLLPQSQRDQITTA